MFKLDKNLHHAYCFEGDVDYITDLLLNFLEKDFKIKGNPDFWMGEYDRFGINDGRKINDFQLRKADKKIIVIKTNFITREAQNSLLKMFEEPTANTHFFIIVPSKEILLPTLQSKSLLIQIRLNLPMPSAY